jgi:protein arginine N-methyltransferase 3
MSCLRREATHVPAVDVVRAETVATTASQLMLLDLATCNSRDISFKSPFTLKATHTEGDLPLTALVGYFDVFFDLNKPVSFSTGPLATPTHWKQTIFFIDEPIIMKPGELKLTQNLLQCFLGLKIEKLTFKILPKYL